MDHILLVFILVIIFVKLISLSSRKGNFSTKESSGDSQATNKPETITPESDYRKKIRVMNKSERQMYKILQSVLDNKFIVLSKVRIEDFVDINQDNLPWGERQGLRGKIKSRHVDFLICEIQTTKPLMAIEVDGKSHRSLRRLERDQFVYNLYEEIGLPLVKISVGSNFTSEAMKIKNILINFFPPSLKFPPSPFDRLRIRMD
jgi:hypothetical protein